MRARDLEVWIDDDIPKGDFWANRLIETLSASSAVIVIMSPEAKASEWVGKEILIAQEHQIPIFPLLLRGEKFPILIDRQYENVEGGNLPSDKFFDRLAEVIALNAQELPENSPIESTESSNHIPLTQAHIQAEMRLLTELWKYISSNHTNNVIQSVHNRNLTDDYFTATFVKYLHLREEFPEKHFINVDLESAFTEFDRVLVKFCNQLSLEETVEYISGRYIFVPAYKRPEVMGSFQTEDVFHRNLENHRKTNKLGQEVVEQHRELVRIIKLVMPNFTFSDNEIS